MKLPFGVEIIDCENGYIVLDGNSLVSNQPYQYSRKKWIVKTPKELGELVEKLSVEALEGEKK